MAKKPKVCIVGAESWGSAISTAVCKNVLRGEYDSRVHIYVYDELVRSSYLSEVMNERHENIKYLPGIKLDENLVAINDLVDAAKEADILIFATSHTFLKPYCNILAGKLKSTAYAVSMIKGLEHIRDGEIDLYSHTITKQLNIPCYSVMSANSAMEMAQGKLCEITIGCNNETHAQQLANLFQTENCKVFSIDDVYGVELCNTLKDLVALSAGFIDGLRLGDNARVICLHLGLKEMMRFIKTFNPSTKLSTFFESCGVANSVASSYADKNVTFAKTFVTSRKTVQEIEANLLNGRKLLGPVIAGEIFAFLEKEKLQEQYPLFAILHRICQHEVPPEAIVDILRTHPDLSNCSITRLQKEEYTLPISDLDDVLENLADTVPEHSPNLLESVISKHSIQGLYDEEENLLDPYNQYFRIPNTNMELTEFLDHCEKSKMTAVAAIDAAQPGDGNLEYSFEIGSMDNKPDIYLKLQDITAREPVESVAEIDPAIRLNPDRDAVGSTNLNSEFQFRSDQASREYLSVKGQPAELGQSETGKSDKEIASPIAGLTDLIEKQMGPYNDKFKALKVRVKVKNDELQSKEPSKKALNRVEIPSNDMKVRKAGSKSDTTSKSDAKSNEKVETEPTEEIPGKKPQKAAKCDQKEEILYDRDSVYDKRSSVDKSNVTRLMDMIKIRENNILERELIEHSNNTNERLKPTSNDDDMSEQSKSQNVFPISQGGYTVDYIKVMRPKTQATTIGELQQTNSTMTNEKPWKGSSLEVPLQYPKTEYPYHTIKPELEFHSYNQDELRLSGPEQQPQKQDMKNMFKTIQDPIVAAESGSNFTKEDQKNSFKALESEPIVAEESDSKSKELVEALSAELNRDDMDDEKRLKMAQEFLDEQEALINNLVKAAESIETQISKDELETPAAKLNDQQLNQETLPEPKVLETSMQYHSEDNKKAIQEPSEIQMDQNVSAFEHYQHADYVRQQAELENRLQESSKIESKDKDSTAQGVLTKDVENWNKENSKYQLSALDELEKAEALLEEDILRAFQSPKSDFDKILESESRFSDERFDGGSSMLGDDQQSLALVKKNQVHGLEDPNLRFYHGKNDSEQGPEWDWLLDSQKENSKEKTKERIVLSSINDNQFDEPAEKAIQPVAIYDENKKAPKKKSRTIKSWETFEKDVWTQEPHQVDSVSQSKYLQYRNPNEMSVFFEGKELREIPQEKSSRRSGSLPDAQFVEEIRMHLQDEGDLPGKKSTHSPDSRFVEEIKPHLEYEGELPQISNPSTDLKFLQETPRSEYFEDKQTHNLPRKKLAPLRDSQLTEDLPKYQYFETPTSENFEDNAPRNLPRKKSTPLPDSHSAEDLSKSKYFKRKEPSDLSVKKPARLPDDQFVEEIRMHLQYEGDLPQSADLRFEDFPKSKRFERKEPYKLPRKESSRLPDEQFVEEIKMHLQDEDDLNQKKSIHSADAKSIELSSKSKRFDRIDDLPQKKSIHSADSQFAEVTPKSTHFEGKQHFDASHEEAEMYSHFEDDLLQKNSNSSEYFKNKKQSKLPRKKSIRSSKETEMPVHFEGQELRDLPWEKTPQEDLFQTERYAEETRTRRLNKEPVSEEGRPFWIKPVKGNIDTTASELNAEEVEEILEKEKRKETKHKLSDSEVNKEHETIPQEDINSKVIKSADTEDSNLKTKEFDVFSDEDYYDKMMEPTGGYLSVEEMLLEDEHYRAILDGDEEKLESTNEIEYLLEKPTKSSHEEEEKLELSPELEKDPNDPLQKLMTRGRKEAIERTVDYKGKNPYLKDRKFSQRDVEYSDLVNSHREREHKMRKKVVVRPSFHPPINPRVRIPRPPFDVRDHEYHTVNYRPPPDLMRHTTLPLRRTSVPYQAKQVATASNVVKLPRPVMRLPSSVMRSSVLAVEVGLFAAFFSRYRGGCK